MSTKLPITCITVCVNYDDYFALCLERAATFFRRWIVVTTPEDIATQALCAKHGVECYRTAVFYRDGSTFNKGAALNEVMQVCRPTGWLLFMDSDIVLPKDFPKQLDPEKLGRLKPDCLYGASRQFIETYEDYKAERVANPGKIDTRVIGFYQMVHSDALATYTFREHTNASRYDDAVRKYFDEKGKVHKLPIVVWHLGVVKRNWDGRVTPRFW